MNKTALLFLLDQSGSMGRDFDEASGDKWELDPLNAVVALPTGDGLPRRKSEAAAECLNDLRYSLMVGSAIVPHYNAEFDVQVILFGGEAGVSRLWPEGWIPGAELERVARGFDQLRSRPTWVYSGHEGLASLCAALDFAREELDEYLRGCSLPHDLELPPTVVIITDGSAMVAAKACELGERMINIQSLAPLCLMVKNGEFGYFRSHFYSPLLFAIAFMEGVRPSAFPARGALWTESDDEDKHVTILRTGVSGLSDVQRAAASALGISLSPVPLNPKGLVVNVTARGLMVALATFTNKPVWRT